MAKRQSNQYYRESCPARDAILAIDVKGGALQFTMFCHGGILRSGAGSSTQAMESSDPEEAFLDTVVADTQNSWTVQVQVGSKKLIFMQDTRVEVMAMAIAEDAYTDPWESYPCRSPPRFSTVRGTS